MDYLEELPTEKTQTYEEVCHAMDQRFGSERMSTIFRAELNHRKRKDGESLPALGQDIRRLAKLAYPGFADTVVEQLAQEKFVDALPDAKLRLQIHHARPRSLEDAIEFALHNEAWTIAEDARQPSGKIRGVSDQGELVHLVKELQA